MNIRRDYPDKYSRLNSPVHSLSAGTKSAVGLVLIALAILTPLGFWPVHVFVAGCAVAALLVSRVPPVFVVKRILMFEPAILVMALVTLLQPGGGVKFLSVVVRSTLSLTVVVLLANTTPFSEFLRLMRRFRAPAIAVTILALMYRYVFILFDEMQKLRRARASRAYSHSAGYHWGVRASILGQLFIRSTERAERIYAAMTARGWET